MAETPSGQTTQAEILASLLGQVNWSVLRPRRGNETESDWINSLAEDAHEALGSILHSFPGLIINSGDTPFPQDKKGEKEKILDWEVKRACLEHVLTIWIGYFSPLLGIHSDKLQSEGGLPFKEQFFFVPEYRERISKLDTVKEAANLSEDESRRLERLEAMQLEDWLNRLRKCASDPKYLRQSILSQPRIIEARNLLRRLKDDPEEPLLDTERNRLSKLENRGTGWSLEEEIEMLKELENGKPEKLNQRIAEIENKIQERNKLRERKYEHNRAEAQIEVEKETDQEIVRHRQLVKLMDKLPELEPAYRQAIAELREKDFFYPGVPIPSFREICYTLFYIEGYKSRLQPYDYEAPPGLAEQIPELIKRFRKNPALLRTVMMMGLMGHAPAVYYYDDQAFEIGSTAKDSSVMHGVDCVYDKEAERYANGKQNGNVVDQAAFMSGQGFELKLMHRGPYLYMKIYPDEEARRVHIFQQEEKLREKYPEGLDAPFPETFDTEKGHWARGTFESSGASYLDTPDVVRQGDGVHSKNKFALAGFRLGDAVLVMPHLVNSHILARAWRGSLRVSKA